MMNILHAIDQKSERLTAGRFDGMRFDSDGRLWAATDDGVHCLEKDGTLIGKVKIPEICSNVVFGGAKRNMLYVTATNSLYGVLLHVNGAKTFVPTAAAGAKVGRARHSPSGIFRRGDFVPTAPPHTLSRGGPSPRSVRVRALAWLVRVGRQTIDSVLEVLSLTS